jgi:hypothetical protein
MFKSKTKREFARKNKKRWAVMVSKRETTATRLRVVAQKVLFEGTPKMQ